MISGVMNSVRNGALRGICGYEKEEEGGESLTTSSLDMLSSSILIADGTNDGERVWSFFFFGPFFCRVDFFGYIEFGHDVFTCSDRKRRMLEFVQHYIEFQLFEW